MATVAFLVVLLITIQITNVKNNTKANEDVLEFSRIDSIIIFICFMVSFLLNYAIKEFLRNYYWISVAAIAFVYAMILIIVNNSRERLIQRKQDQIVKIYQALSDIFGKFDRESIDFTNTPFEYEEDHKTKNITKITIDTSRSDGKFNENTITLAQYSINKFFPESQWISKVDYPKRSLEFRGLPKPPTIAKFPGTDYRPTAWIPLGVSGQGEVGWNMGSVSSKDLGISSYVGENGKPIEAVDMPSAPQCLTLGSPLSLNTIIPTTKGYKTMKTIEIGDYVFDINNNPSKVIGMSEIHMSNKMYEMSLEYKGNFMKIKSDEIHNFPILIQENKEIISIIEILTLWKQDCCIKIFGKSNNHNILWNIIEIKEIENELVRCIKIESKTHLFLITDKIEEDWSNNPSNSNYNFNACATRNTGGGKSIWIDQEIDIL